MTLTKTGITADENKVKHMIAAYMQMHRVLKRLDENLSQEDYLMVACRIRQYLTASQDPSLTHDG